MRTYVLRPRSVSEPFVALDGGIGRIHLFREPEDVFVAHDAEGVAEGLAWARQHVEAGAELAGYLAYEAGVAFQPRTTALPTPTPPLWLAAFRTVAEVDADDFRSLLPVDPSLTVGALRPAVNRSDYITRVERALELIQAGDLYQVNLTFPAELDFKGDPLALSAQLRSTANAPYSAIVSTGDETILSLSPELFFAMADGRIRCKPMKGTAPRTGDRKGDDLASAQLGSDPKQRAENLMIVDLMRNDLSRVSEPGSVSVSAL